MPRSCARDDERPDCLLDRRGLILGPNFADLCILSDDGGAPCARTRNR